jgi:hypothetical protein
MTRNVSRINELLRNAFHVKIVIKEKSKNLLNFDEKYVKVKFAIKGRIHFDS